MTLPPPTGLRWLPRSPYRLSGEGESRLAVASYFDLPPVLRGLTAPRLAPPDSQALSKPRIPTGPNSCSEWINSSRRPSECQEPDRSRRGGLPCARSVNLEPAAAPRPVVDSIGRMRLLPLEEDRLVIFMAAELARRHRAAGLQLNHPETVALICDAMLEAARSGATFREVEAAGRGAVRPTEVLDVVRELVYEVRVEVLLDDGMRFV